jgi:two-component system cell cycle sensor histidine kinase/response regulator CckA
MQAIQNKKKVVLFVDDEEMVLTVGSLMLQKLGCNVFTASRGQEAIDIFKKNEVDFVVLDMQMPGMNGYEIYHHLKEIQPQVKILLASGYTVDNSEKRIESIGFDGYLQKPFTLKQLSEKIETVWTN